MEEKGLPVFVVAPSTILRPVQPGAKTDRLDCLKPAECAAKGLAKPIAVPSEEEEADRSLVRRRRIETAPGQDGGGKKRPRGGAGDGSGLLPGDLQTPPVQKARGDRRVFGSGPMVRHGGKGRKRGGIVPTGRKRLRSILVEAAWTFKRYDPGAREFYNRTLARCGVTQKAIPALARKPAIVIRRLCLEQRPYRSAAVNF